VDQVDEVAHHFAGVLGEVDLGGGFGGLAGKAGLDRRVHAVGLVVEVGQLDDGDA